MFTRSHIIITAISSQCDSSIFWSALSTGAVPGSAELALLEESAGPSNEQQTLRIANKLTLEYYSRDEDERRRATPSSKNTQTYTHIYVPCVYISSIKPGKLESIHFKKKLFLLDLLFCCSNLLFTDAPSFAICAHLSLPSDLVAET